mgnify:CR=1 FL=1
MQEIIIEIEEDGKPTIEGKGFVGAECKQYTEALEAGLGEVERVTLKPEYRQARAPVGKAGG